jgi:hypothetical protein
MGLSPISLAISSTDQIAAESVSKSPRTAWSVWISSSTTVWIR